MYGYLSQQQYLLENLRNIATVAGSVLIPLAIGYTARVRERKRATLAVIRSFTTDGVITGRLQRLFTYRVFKANGGPPVGPSNPYDSDSGLIADSIFILNLCDTVAQEVEEGLVSRKMLYHSLGPTLIGVRDVILHRLEHDFKMDLQTAYNEFRSMVQGIEDFQQRRMVPFVSRIPDQNSRRGPPAPRRAAKLDTSTLLSTFMGLMRGD